MQCNVKCCAPRVELITIKIVTKRRIWHELFGRFFTFWKISTANCESWSATYRRTKCLVLAKYIWCSNRWRKQRPNRCMIGDAIIPQTGKNDQKCCSEFVALLCRYLTLQRKTAKVHNYSPSGAQQSQRYVGKFTSCLTIGAHKLVRSEPFLDYLYEL